MFQCQKTFLKPQGKQEGHKFEASLDSIARPNLQKKKKDKETERAFIGRMEKE
jgi:hypothetical protein